jgi:hypothetical protein
MNPYAYHGHQLITPTELQEKFADLADGEEVDLEVAIAGRILARRVLENWRSSIFRTKPAQFSYTSISRKSPPAWQMCPMPSTT